MREAPQQSRASQIVRFADFEVDLRGRELRKNGARVPLQEQPLQVLAVLLEHAGEVVTRKEFCQHLWPSDTFVDFDNSLNTAINKIREALGDSTGDPHFVETLPRRGYRFIAPLKEGVEPQPIEKATQARPAFQPPRPTRDSPCGPDWVGANGRAIAQLLVLEARLETRPQPHRLARRASLAESLSRLGPEILR